MGKLSLFLFISISFNFKNHVILRHDLCYGSCLGKMYCDDQFSLCLAKACDALPIVRKQMCYMDKSGLVMAVRVFGGKFYCAKKI